MNPCEFPTSLFQRCTWSQQRTKHCWREHRLPKTPPNSPCCSVGAAGIPPQLTGVQGDRILHFPFTGDRQDPSPSASGLPLSRANKDRKAAKINVAAWVFNSSCFHRIIRSRCWFCSSLLPLSLAQRVLMTDGEINLSAAIINQGEPAIPSPHSLQVQPASSLAQRPKSSSSKSIENPHRFIWRMMFLGMPRAWKLLGEKPSQAV